MILTILSLFTFLCTFTNAKGGDKIVVFTGGEYSGYQTWNWTAITHLAFWTLPSDEVRQLAKENNVKLFCSGGLPDKKDWTDQSKREAYVQSVAERVKQNKVDGVFFDYEGNGLSKDEKAGYTAIAQETTAALKPLNASLFICVGGRPTYEFRDYDYTGLAQNSEFLFVMGYDMHFWDDYSCVLKGTCSPAEASIKELKAGVSEYMAQVTSNKLVLGLPWYGQRYTQVLIPINEGQIDYKDILDKVIDAGHIKKTYLDTDSNSMKIDCKSRCVDDSKVKGNVIWYDDAQTLKPKYALARDNDWLGVGIWKIDDLPVPDDKGNDPHKAEREAMWTSLSNWNLSPEESNKKNEDGADDAIIIQTAEAFPSKNTPDRLKSYHVTSQSSGKPSILTLSVDTDAKQQVVKGFGGAITDSVAHIFSQLNETLQAEVVESLWGKTGQQYNLGRLTIGATDFSVDVYNYNPNSGDYNQSKFSIDHDLDKIIPLAKKAQEASTDALTFVSTSWSPPGWMKRPWLARKGYMRNSAKPGMIDDPKIYQSYALYLSKYLTAYKAQGVNISMMTIQNEPDSADHMFPVSYPCNNFNGTGEGEFLKSYLGPQIRKDHPDLKIYIHDGQKYHDVPILNRVQDIIKAAGGDFKFIDGVAFHWYGNNLANYQYLEALHEKYPDLPLLGTEATLEAPFRQKIGTSPWKEAQKYAVDIIGDLNAGAEGWIEWNVLLDTSGGPTCIGPTSNEFCTPLAGHCDAPILADVKKQTLEYRNSYFIMAHFSRYIERGSKIISIQNKNNTDTGLKFTAALTPSNKVVVVVANPQDSKDEEYQLEIGGKFIAYKIHSHSVQTIVMDL